MALIAVSMGHLVVVLECSLQQSAIVSQQQLFFTVTLVSETAVCLSRLRCCRLVTVGIHLMQACTHTCIHSQVYLDMFLHSVMQKASKGIWRPWKVSFIELAQKERTTKTFGNQWQVCQCLYSDKTTLQTSYWRRSGYFSKVPGNFRKNEK